MFSFLFAVLGSVTFWILYAAVSFFGTGMTLKHFAPHTYKYITTGEMYNKYDREGYIILAITHMLFWPLIVLGVIAWFIASNTFKLFFGRLVWPLFCKGIKVSTLHVPKIKFDRE